ncbi:MAG: hypothetical protein QOG59_3420, partial [Solirubrobacteraceae bacterium]|nr:hypothetical protein [Solirubrobacteraceae bacterium]
MDPALGRLAGAPEVKALGVVAPELA